MNFTYSASEYLASIIFKKFNDPEEEDLMGRDKTAVFYSRNSSKYQSETVLLMIPYSLNMQNILLGARKIF